MNDDPDLPPDDRDRLPRASSIVQPADDVWAVVRTGPTPDDVPERLTAFVVRRGDDWALTDDVVAFGQTDIVTEFMDWRAGWTLTRALTTASNLARLVGWIEERERSEALTAVVAELRSQPDAEIAFALVGVLADELERLRWRLAEDDGLGHGIVDDTPGAARTGLVRAWPSYGAGETVAARRHVRVELVPADGLVVHVGGGTTSPIAPLALAEATAEGWRVSDGATEIEIGRRDAQPLAWVVPGSTRWRVRRVPHAVVWASTLAGLEACIDRATRSRSAILVTSRRPIAPI